ncbi:MAG: hypothetical protein U0821_07510 [Chloroflexota bacterium]
MLEQTQSSAALIESMLAAFARGDSADGERLMLRALDAGIPWDEVTAAAAQGYARQASTNRANTRD